MIQLGDLIVILDLHRQGLSISAIARRTGRDPKTIRKYIARGLEPPAYGPRQAGRPSKLAPYLDYLRERIAAFPDLSAVRLTLAHALAGEHVRTDQIEQRLEQRRAPAHLVGERRQAQLDAGRSAPT